MEFTTTIRGTRSLIHEGYRYTLNQRTADGQIYWRCLNRACPGRVVTDVNDQLVSFNNKHTHQPNPSEIAVEKVKERMKKRAKEETTPIPCIYHDAIQQVARQDDREEVAPVLPTFSSLKSSLYRERRKRYPPLPQSVDLHFDGEWAKTLGGEEFMMACRDGIFMFSTESDLRIISESSALYLDGTFQICPHLFYQVFTIHAFRHGQQFPFAYFLLPNETRESYNTTFMLLKETAQNLGLTVEPERIWQTLNLLYNNPFRFASHKLKGRDVFSTLLSQSGEKCRA